MNDFTKEELENILGWGLCYYPGMVIEETPLYPLINKIQSMIDNYSAFNTKKIAESHLNEASSLISHAKALLEMKYYELLHEK